MDKKYTAGALIKKFKGKFIDVYPFHYEKKDNNGNWLTVYEVRKVSDVIRENCNLPEDCIIK